MNARDLFDAIAKLPSFAPTVGISGGENTIRVEMRRAGVHETDYLRRDTVLGILNEAVNTATAPTMEQHPDAKVAEARKALRCLFIAVDESVVRDVIDKCEAAFDIARHDYAPAEPLEQGVTFNAEDLYRAYVEGGSDLGQHGDATKEQIHRAADAYVKLVHLQRGKSAPSTEPTT